MEKYSHGDPEVAGKDFEAAAPIHAKTIDSNLALFGVELTPKEGRYLTFTETARLKSARKIAIKCQCVPSTAPSMERVVRCRARALHMEPRELPSSTPDRPPRLGFPSIRRDPSPLGRCAQPLRCCRGFQQDCSAISSALTFRF